MASLSGDAATALPSAAAAPLPSDPATSCDAATALPSAAAAPLPSDPATSGDAATAPPSAAAAQLPSDPASSGDAATAPPSAAAAPLPSDPAASSSSSTTTATTAASASPPPFPALLQSAISQYSLGERGKSACTAIALCGAAALLPLLDAGLPVTAAHLTQAVAAGMEAAAVFEGAHCSAAEVWTVHQDSPALGGALRAFNVGAERLGSLSDAAGLEALCAQARSERGVDAARHTAIVLTKVPETVCLLLPPVAAAAAAAAGARFALFDSHPRPGRECAHLLSVGSLEALLAQVRQLFPALANQPGEEEWDQGVLYQYNAFEGSFWQAK